MRSKNTYNALLLADINKLHQIDPEVISILLQTLLKSRERGITRRWKRQNDGELARITNEASNHTTQGTTSDRGVKREEPIE